MCCLFLMDTSTCKALFVSCLEHHHILCLASHLLLLVRRNYFPLLLEFLIGSIKYTLCHVLLKVALTFLSTPALFSPCRRRSFVEGS